MPVLNIGGRKVTVDDSFTSLSPDEQNETVDEIASSLGMEGKPDEPQKFGGVAMNATAGANETLYGIAGAPVDLARGAMNLGVRGINAVAGTNIPQIPDDSFGGSKSIANAMGAIRPELDPANTQAQTGAERVARGVGQGVAGTVLPAGVVGAAQRAGVTVSPLVAALAGRSNSGRAVLADAVAGAGGGAGSAAAQEVTSDKFDGLGGLAGGVVGGGLGALATGIPALTRAVAEASGNFLAPLSAGGRERLAGQRLVEGASDPKTAVRAIDEAKPSAVPGSKPTTFQETGDMGLGAMERAAATRDPAAFQERRGEQNAARRDALDGIQATGAPEQVSRLLKERLDAIDGEAARALDDAQTWEQGASRAIGAGQDPEVAGAAMRSRLQAARDTAKAKEEELWGAVDPDGTLALSATNARDYLQQSVREMPASARPPGAEEASIYNVLGQYGDVTSFRELQALQSRVKTEMRRERAEGGETPAYARLAGLNSALFRDLESAAVRKVEEQTAAVARGEMRAEDTFAAWLQRDAEGWIAERAGQAASGNGGARPVGFAGGAASAVPGVRGTASQSSGRSGGAASNPRLSGEGLDPNFDDAALGRLTQARDATNERAATFDNPTLKPALRRPATNAPYQMRDASVAKNLFTAGAGSFEKIQTFRQAVGNDPAALGALEGYAIDSLRRSAIDPNTGAINAARLESWRRAHSDALRAFPELDIRIGNAADAANAVEAAGVARKQAVDAAQAGALGRLIGTEDPQDVVRIVGGLFSRQDGVKQLGELRRRVGDDKEALAGLRKAVADHVSQRMISNTEAATTGRELVSADQFQTFVKTNRNALHTVFDEREVRIMEAVAADLQKANRSIASVKLPNQSNTAQDTLATRQTDSPTTIFGKIAVAAATAGGGVGMAAGSPIAAAAATVGTGLIGALRQNGIETIDDLVRDALLNPQRARYLMAKVPADGPKAQFMMDVLARRYAKAAGAGAAVEPEDKPERGPIALPDFLRPQANMTPLQRAVVNRQEKRP